MLVGKTIHDLPVAHPLVADAQRHGQLPEVHWPIVLETGARVFCVDPGELFIHP